MDSAPGKKNNTAQNDQKPHGASSNERRHLSQGEGLPPNGEIGLEEEPGIPVWIRSTKRDRKGLYDRASRRA